MALIWVGSKKIDVDLIEELSQFEWGAKSKFTDEKLVAPSPFRYDKSPSFFVNLVDMDGKEVAGTWLDSGASEDDDYRSGNFVRLLAFLRNESEDETELYLRELYDIKPYSNLSLNVNFKVKKEFKPLEIPNWLHDFHYLPSRGIPVEIAMEADVRISNDMKAVCFPWKNPAGETIAIKYRRTADKVFYYEKGGKPLNQTLFGIDLVYKHRPKTVVICEAEIDALTWWSLGRAAVAVGGSNFSEQQAQLLIRAGIQNIILNGDNDLAGHKLERLIQKRLYRHLTFYKALIPEPYKDVNEYKNIPTLRKLDKTLFQ